MKKKIIKGVLACGLIATSAFTLASCSSGRNSTVPYGSLDLNSTVATSGDNKLTLNTYYNQLRSKGYSLVTKKMNKLLYAKEYAAIKKILTKNYTDFSDDELKTLSFDGEKITEERFNELKDEYTKTVNNALANAVYSTASSDAYLAYEADDIETYIEKYKEASLKKGITVTDIQLAVDTTTDDLEFDLTDFPEELYEQTVLTQAGYLYSAKKLWTIADVEYLDEDDDDNADTLTKNNYYVFKESTLKTNYESTYMTYGTYKAIVIAFNSRREAIQYTSGITIDANNALESYVSLYNTYYNALKENGVDFYANKNNSAYETSDEFTFTVSKNENELSNLSSDAKTLVTDTLEDGEYLVEPRNINGKYYLAYRLETIYDLTGTNEKLKWDDLYKDENKDTLCAEGHKYSEILTKVKNNVISTNATGYNSIAFRNVVKELNTNNNIQIYDPLFELSFNTSYTDYYDLIERTNTNIGKNYIFKFGDDYYTVEDFYHDASLEYGADIINNYFQLEYAYKYLNDYLTSDEIKANTDTLNDAINTFNSNNNSTYPVEIGLENFLVGTYGYNNKDDVLKYSINANSLLSTYKAKTLFKEWAAEGEESTYVLSDSAKATMEKLLAAGNPKYNEIFSINVDHILIKIDFDADGTPDDPREFLKNHPDQTTAFNNAVNELAQAIYKEAIFKAYSDNTLYNVLKYIVDEYNQGNKLLSDSTKTWDDYKSDFHFSLTAEQLASSSSITQSTVTNFVKEFQDYIKDMFAKAVSDNYDKVDNGQFFTPTTGALSDASDASSVTVDTLCLTQYGYHLLVLNSFDSANSLKYTSTDDTSSSQANIQVLVYTEENDEDTEDDDVDYYVTLSSYNENATEANVNQLFIYYGEKKNGASNSLDSTIYQLLQTLFDDVIDKYSSSNFQTWVLLDKLNIQTTDATLTAQINADKNYYANQVTNYGEDSEYASWVASGDTAWVRPDDK